MKIQNMFCPKCEGEVGVIRKENSMYKSRKRRMALALVVIICLNCFTTVLASDEDSSDDSWFTYLGGWFSDRGMDLVDIGSDVGNWFGDRADDVVVIAGNVGDWFGDRADDVVIIAGDVGDWFGDRADNVVVIAGDVGDWFGDRADDATVIARNVGEWTVARVGDVQIAASVVGDCVTYIVSNADFSKLVTIDYYLDSGEKVLLGDYSDKDPTLLSIAANLAASIANVDLGMDIRDLAYDVQNFHNDDVKLSGVAFDAIALLPVIGVVKGFKHTDTIVDGVKVASNVAEAASDAEKKLDTAVDLVDNVHDAAKAVEITDTAADVAKAADIADEITDAANVADDIHDAAKSGDKIADVADGVHDQYLPVRTYNDVLENKEHAETGIRFTRKYLDYSDGQRITGVFPEFDAVDEIMLPDNLLKSTFETQKKYLMEKLQKQIADPDNNMSLISRLTQDELDDIAEGILPSRFVWHHNETEGLMQLVDVTTHNKTNHTGGMALWGRGYN